MTKDVLNCAKCGAEWTEQEPGEKVTCEHCGARVSRDVVAKEEFMRGKFLYLECETIDDLIDATDSQLKRLRDLRSEGYEVADSDAVQNDYIYLRKPAEEATSP